MAAAFTSPDWATRHCAELAADRLKESTGRDLWRELGGCPRSWREASAVYRRLGVTSLKDAVTSILGEPIAPCHAMRGDIAMLESPGVGPWSLGIVRGDLVECVDVMQPIGKALCCWRIGKD